MKILTGRQIREADRATVEREPVSSLDLMERAARGLAEWMAGNVDADKSLLFCCGKGGNGGDGLSVARILTNAGRLCSVLLTAAADELAPETRTNLSRLPGKVEIQYFTATGFPDIEQDTVIIDALLGVGVTGGAREPVKSVIEWINALPNRVISIDIPSGMATEQESGDTTATRESATLPLAEPATRTAPVTNAEPVVRAETTLTIEFPKLAMLQPDIGECAGKIVVVPIGLDGRFIAEAATPYYYITEDWVESLRTPRTKFSHKGSYGHALLVCGSESMPGAVVLAAGGALRSGCGLVTVHITKAERFTLTANHPSAMLSLDDGKCFSAPPDRLERFSAIGAGPGLGRDPKTAKALEELLTRASVRGTTMVLDADALNIIADNPNLQRFIPAGSVLTPHPGELRRLVGEWLSDGEKLEKASKLASATSATVIVKGAHSAICTPDGRFIFNSSGTPGMAKGGSGDVLAGLVTGLAARGYDAETAAIIGVYLHGRAGERAAEVYGEEAMNASDLAEFL